MNYEVKPLKKEDIHLEEWEFDFQQRAEQPILLSDLFSRAVNQYFVKYITGQDKTYGYIFTDSNKFYHSKSESSFYYQELFKRVNAPEYLSQMLTSSLLIPTQFNVQADKDVAYLKENKEISNEALADLWKKIDEEFIKVIPWFWYPWLLSGNDILTNRVKNDLEKYRTSIEKITDFEEAFLSVIFPLKKTAFQHEQEEMFKLVSLAEDKENFSHDSSFKKEAHSYLAAYNWLTTFLLNPMLPMTYSELVERVEQYKKNNYIEVYTKQKEENAKKEMTAVEVMKVIESDTELVAHIQNARTLAYNLTAGIEEAYIACSKYLTVLQLIAERIDIEYEEIKLFFSEEIHLTLKGDCDVSKDELEERKKGFVMMMYKGEQYVTFGEAGHALSRIIDEELNKVDTSIVEFKGQIACKGHVTGKVRIAETPHEAHELEEGEILVCPMTNPDYVPAMKRSAAIITNEGGMLSHAAIMSREFNKPCVIGTKIATKLLKTGDIVEVDANTGVIKIIS